MEFHEAANIFPMMTVKEYADLRDSIQRNGQRTPILLFEDKILDGRNRYTVCLELGIEPKVVQWDGDDPWEYVWDANAERRHLEPMQKVLLFQIKQARQEEWQEERRIRREAANLARAEKLTGVPRDDRKISTDIPLSRLQSYDLARQANVSNATAARAQALFNARPDLADQVAHGKMKFTEAERTRKKDEYANKEPTLPDGKYRVIYADPPWKYGNTQPAYHGVQDDHYPVMSLKDICAMPIKEIAEENAVLFLWATSPVLEESFQVIKAWGFEYKSSFVWDKVKHNMGHYNSVRHEFLLVCTRGSCTPDKRQLFDSVVSEERTEHSRKPETFRVIIDTIYPHGKRIELFARTTADGWDKYGNE